jgi:hypothetical protein
MKRILLILIGFPFTVFSAQLPVTVPDTILVSDTETTYLLFPEEVLLVDIGRSGEYFAKIEGNSVFLKARSKQTGPTNLFIRYGQEYYTARLLFHEKPLRYLYEPGSKASHPSPAFHKEEKGGEPDTELGLAGLRKVKAAPENWLGAKKTRHGLTLRITHLQIDQQLIYLGMQLRNSSSIDYRLDFAGFSFQEKRGRRFSRNNNSRKEVRPFISEAPSVIPAHGESSLFYALPLYAMTSRGKLLIQLREREGARVLDIAVPARRINQAPILTTDHGN